jgi:Subtilase family
MDQIAFPARLRQYVICIGAAHGDGKTASITAEDTEFQGYAVPGIGVCGASIKRTSSWGGYTTKRKDGTSSATPIAAGIAALFIEYSRGNNLGEARSHENMLKLFSAMSAETGDTYRFLRPWTLLDEEKVKAALDTRKTEVDNRTLLRTIKGSSTHYLMILIIDADSRTQVLLEHMDGTCYSLQLLISVRAGKRKTA